MFFVSYTAERIAIAAGVSLGLVVILLVLALAIVIAWCSLMKRKHKTHQLDAVTYTPRR